MWKFTKTAIKYTYEEKLLTDAKIYQLIEKNWNWYIFIAFFMSETKSKNINFLIFDCAILT